jgi:hypothetical protein
MTGDEPIDPLIGTRIGPCRIEMRLAAGGMGVVYRARHLQLDQDVAVKILAPSLAQDNEYVTRFFREAGAAGQIDHPNVVRVVDVGKHEDKYFLIMEFVEGETLDRILDRDRKLPLDRATRYAREIAAGLAAAHRAGIIHRDVKPGNIIVSPDDKTHLTDFGLARHTETRKGLTIEGTFLGTPEYASPEQVEGRRLDHRTDLYSLGVSYYQLLSGTLPFLGESPMEIAIKRTKEEPRPVESALPGIDTKAASIIRKLLHLEPVQRYQSATDLIRDLDSILQGDSGKARKSETTKATRGHLYQAATKRRIKSVIHWDLMTTAVALCFLSGALAGRDDGGFLASWAARDRGFLARILMAGFGTLVAAGAILFYRKELATPGRWTGALFLILLMLFGGLAAGTLIERDTGENASVTAMNAFRAVGRSLSMPVNFLALGFLGLFSSALVSFERQPGTHRVIISRVLLLAGFGFIYAFGAQGELAAPMRTAFSEPELTIPLAIATLLATIFGFLLLTGYGFEGWSKIFGAVLCVGAAAGIYSWAVLAAQPGKSGWTGLLASPFDGLGQAFLGHGTLLAPVIALGVVQRSLLDAAVRQASRVRRKF